MALEAAVVERSEASWLKRLRKDKSEASASKTRRVVVQEAAKIRKPGFVDTKSLGFANKEVFRHRHWVSGVGFVHKNLVWSVGGRSVNVYEIGDADVADASISVKHKVDLESPFAVGAVCVGRESVYCITESSDVTIVNLNCGVLEGRLPHLTQLSERNALLKIEAAPAQSNSWSLLSVLDDVGRVYIIDTRMNRTVRKLNAASQLTCAKFLGSSQGEARLLAGNVAGEVFEWDLRSGDCLYRKRIPGSLGVSEILVRPEDNTLIVADQSGVITQHRLYDDDNSPSFELVKEYKNLSKVANVLTGHQKHPLLFAGSGETPDCGKLINLKDKFVYQNWPGAQSRFGQVSSAQFNEENGLIALGNKEGFVKIWSLQEPF